MHTPPGLRTFGKFVGLMVLLILVSDTTGAAQQADLGTEVENEDFQSARSEWFYGQRAYPQGYIPSRARLRALHQLDDMMALRDRLEAAAALGRGEMPPAGFGTNWRLIGPRPEALTDAAPPFMGTPNVSGRVTALAPDPRGAIYLGSAVGGVRKSFNNGGLWLPLM